ncbi:serine hydrolase [Reyranella sp. CPCC 100927]|uniref:serine hydrolase n=1 Tax=Reyranella sp. CPCC 100927 TaxID=2599616 RepID=UPI0011B7289E|nr:serine hydrolase [Reyranella sp. CPCC 100927]TWT13024.1 serine hydrolase [Reyranella sp. CPCC 100927]
MASQRQLLWIGVTLWAALSFTWATAHAQPLSRDKVVAALPALEALARQVIESGGVPGLAIAVVHNDEVVYLKGFGHRDVGKADVVDADTVFQIASLSKPVSSTVVAAVVSTGKIGWESRIADLDPAFQLRDPYPTAALTVRDLFAHRSGLPGTAGDDLEDIGFGRAEVLQRLRLVAPLSSFRAGYSYSNAGLTEGAVAAAKPTGKSWESVAEEMLYRPLGMTATSSRHDDFIARTNRAALHIKVDGAWAAKLKRNPDMQAPAGGVSASARDLAQWMRLELADGMYNGQRLIAAAALEEARVPLMARGVNPVTGGASFYGLGWNIEFGRHGLARGHAGAFSVGARTVVTLYPKANLGILVLSNAFPTGVPEGLSDSAADLVFTGKVEKDWIKPWNDVFGGLFGPAVAAAKAAYGTRPAPATPPLPPAAYAGRYANAYVGDAVVTDRNGVLTLSVGPGGGRSYALTHFDRDLFLSFPSPELPDMPSAVRFTIGPNGKAAEVTIDSLNDWGMGTLKRSD